MRIVTAKRLTMNHGIDTIIYDTPMKNVYM